MSETTRRLVLVERSRGARDLQLAMLEVAELVALDLRQRTGNELLLYELLEEATLAIARDAVKRCAGIAPPSEPASDLANTLVRLEAPMEIRAEVLDEDDRELERRIDAVERALERFGKVLGGIRRGG